MLHVEVFPISESTMPSAIFRLFSELDRPIKRRRNLPHWEVPGATYFLTFRLRDALPAGTVQELEMRRSTWLQIHRLTDCRDVSNLSDDKPEGVSPTHQRRGRALA